MKAAADVPDGPDVRRAGLVACSLMRMALALLDRDGETLAASRLQHAIDTFGVDRRAFMGTRDAIVADQGYEAEPFEGGG